MCVCMHMVCVYVVDGEGNSVFTSRVQAVVQMAMYLTVSVIVRMVSVNHFRHHIDVTPGWKMSGAITVDLMCMKCNKLRYAFVCFLSSGL